MGDADLRAADEWWHELPPSRRIQLYRWVEQPAAAPAVSEGQVAITAPGMPRPPRHRTTTAVSS